jgi:hypothetical protein
MLLQAAMLYVPNPNSNVIIKTDNLSYCIPFVITCIDLRCHETYLSLWLELNPGVAGKTKKKKTQMFGIADQKTQQVFHVEFKQLKWHSKEVNSFPVITSPRSECFQCLG